MKKVPPYTLSVLRVPRQLKMSNLDCWGQGESIDTNIVGAWNKKGKVTFAYPRGPRGPGGPESGQMAKS